MKFFVVSSASSAPTYEHGACYLNRNTSWNDWFKYSTVFELTVVDESGTRHSAGTLKIGSTEMDITPVQAEIDGLKQTPLPECFESLNSSYFSLGQSENYYETLASLGGSLRASILESLRDIAFDPSLIPLYRDLDVYRDSVRRDIAESIITG